MLNYLVNKCQPIPSLTNLLKKSWVVSPFWLFGISNLYQEFFQKCRIICTNTEEFEHLFAWQQALKAKTLPLYNRRCRFSLVYWQQTWQQHWSPLIPADAAPILVLMLRVTMTMTLTLTVQSRCTFARLPAGPLLPVGRVNEFIMIIFWQRDYTNNKPASTQAKPNLFSTQSRANAKVRNKAKCFQISYTRLDILWY